MYHRSDIVYLYDGGFQGFLCCVFQAFAQKEDPQMILPQDEAQSLLFDTRLIETRPEQARRVYAAVPAKIGPEALELLQCAFLSDLPDKELLLLEFLRRRVHCHGAKYEPPVLLEKITGRRSIDSEQFLTYLKGKYSAL